MGVTFFFFLHLFSSANFLIYLMASSNLLCWNIVKSWCGMLNTMKKLNAPDLLFYCPNNLWGWSFSCPFLFSLSLSLKSQWLILCHIFEQKISSVENSAALETFSSLLQACPNNFIVRSILFLSLSSFFIAYEKIGN